MFTIRCETCAAKLKVTQPSAIDQKLACPKCGNMIHVQPPSDWIPPPGWELPNLDSSISVSGATSFADFDDIDHLLDQSQLGGAEQLAQSKPGTQAKPGPQAKPGIQTKPGPQAKPTTQSKPLTQGKTSEPTKPSAKVNRGPVVSPPGGPAKPKSQASSQANQGLGTTLPTVTATKAVSNKGRSVNAPAANPAIISASTSVKKRQQLLLIGFAAALGLIALSVVIWWLVTSGNRPQIADNGEQNLTELPPQNPVVDKNANPGADNQPPKIEDVAAAAAIEPRTKNSTETDPGLNESEGNNTAGDIETKPNDPTQPIVNGGPPQVDLRGDPPPTLPVSPIGEAGKTDSEATGNSGNKSQDLANVLNPLGRPDQDLSVAPKLFGAQSVNDALGDLSALLSDTSETSLNELAEVAAEERRVNSAGLSPLFVAKPDPPKIVGTLTDRLAIELAEVQYIQSPMAVEVNQLARLLGYPITFDLLHIDTEELDLFQLMTWDAADMTLDQVLERIFVNAGLSKQLITSGDVASANSSTGLEASGIVIRPVGFDQASTQLYDIPEMSQRTPEQRLELLTQAKLFLAPFLWDQAGGSGTLREAGEQWEVAQIPLGHRALTRWIAKLKAAAELAKQENTVAATEVLETQTASAATNLNQPLNWAPHWERSLDDVLERLRRDTGLRVLVDWDAIVSQGWNPTLRVPGNIRSRSAREFLDQLTQSMELAWRIVDSQTVEITTHERMRVRQDLEIYSLADLAKTGLTAERIRDLLNAVLGVQAGRAGAIWYYDSPTQSLWILAPQWLHQQVEPVLDRLRNKPTE